MNILGSFVLLGILINSAHARTKVVYGIDNRKDIYETSNTMQLKLARSTAGMIKKSQLNKSFSGGLFDLTQVTTLERGQNICPSEKFSQQLLAPICSGFLVGNDTIITAGHCYNSFDLPENVCKEFVWVFDYHMKSSSHDPSKNISISNIYQCKTVLAAKRDNQWDFAIIKLDRPVIGREGLKFRTSGQINKSAPLMVIGHPSGLPTKISAGGKVTKNDEPTRFSTTLDTFHGNSGSAVFDSKTGVVEGILIMGKNDYQPSDRGNPRSCMVVNKCDEEAMNCSAGMEDGIIEKGEIVLRIEKIAHLINKGISKRNRFRKK